MPMDKALSYVALARKAGRIELGEEPVGKAAQIGKAYLILVAKDAADHSWRRAQSFVSGTDQQCIRTGYTKDELGQAIGREALALAAFTDPSMALAFVRSLEQDHGEVIAALENAVKRARPAKPGKRKNRSRPEAK